MEHYCPNCEKYAEMMRDLNRHNTLICVCGYEIIEVWRGEPIYLKSELLTDKRE